MIPIFYVLDATTGTTEAVDTTATAETTETTGTTGTTESTTAEVKTEYKDTIGTFSERAGVAGSVTLLGMVAVFAVLALLWGVIELFHKMLNRSEPIASTPITPASEKKAPKAEPTRVARPKTVSQAAPAQSADDGALIAAITAAVAAARAEEGCTGGFRVVSFRRAQNRKRG